MKVRIKAPGRATGEEELDMEVVPAVGDMVILHDGYVRYVQNRVHYPWGDEPAGKPFILLDLSVYR
jgi:hypothetical protein